MLLFCSCFLMLLRCGSVVVVVVVAVADAAAGAAPAVFFSILSRCRRRLIEIYSL